MLSILTDLMNRAWSTVGVTFCIACLSACMGSQNSKLRLSDLGSRYWQGTYYLSVEGLPSSIQCDVNVAHKNLDDVLVRYKGKDAEPLFDSDDDQLKIEVLKQQCLDKATTE